jgi:hypothetical protein
MDDVYEMFRPIFGIVASVFILYFLITYASNYGMLQEEYQKIKITKNFLLTARDVYLSGNPIAYQDFARYDFSSCHMRTYSPPDSQSAVVLCDFNQEGISPDIPILFSPGEEVFIERDSLDMGWWDFLLISAVPEIRVIFNPVKNDDRTEDIIYDIASHVPSPAFAGTDAGFDTKFAFCSGDNIIYQRGKGEFLAAVRDIEGLSFQECTAELEEGDRLITLRNSCSGFEEGICLDTFIESGFANMYIEGSDEAYHYKDPIDGIAVLLGYTGKDMLGVTYGEHAFEYKNLAFLDRLSFAAGALSERADIIAGSLEPDSECIDPFRALSDRLEAVSGIAEGREYDNIGEMNNLVDSLKEARAAHDEVLGLGCDYYA